MIEERTCEVIVMILNFEPENFENSTIQYFEKRSTRQLRQLIWTGFEQLLSGSNFCGVLEGPYTSR